MDLYEYLTDAMIEHLSGEFYDLLDDVKYTFEEETQPENLPRDLEMALEEIDLKWVIENHIDCCGYRDAIYSYAAEWSAYHADCDEIICDYGIIRAIENHYESGDCEGDLVYKIIEEEGIDFGDKDIYDAIYDDAIDYIMRGLDDWYMEFSTVDANDAVSLMILCDKHDIPHTYVKEGSTDTVIVQTRDVFNNSRTVSFIFKSGYRNIVRANGITMFYDHVAYDEEFSEYDRLTLWSDTESLLGTIKVGDGDEE